MSTQALTYAAPSEEALNSAFHQRYTGICGVNIEHLLDAARAVPLTSAFSLMEPTRDPLRLKSQIATIAFMNVYRPDVPIPRLFSAQLSSANPAGVPYTLIKFCEGTPIAHHEWRNMSNANKSVVVDLLAEQWAKITAPAPFSAIGSIVTDISANTSHPLWHRHDVSQCSSRRSRFNVQRGPTTLAEHWHYHLDATRRDMMEMFPQLDDDARRTLIRCADILRDLVNLAVSLDPLTNPAARSAAPNLALIHADFACWRNVLFSADRMRLEGIIDWDDSVVVPRDLAARYPEELTHVRSWRPDPDDVFAIPPEVLSEDMSSWRIAIEDMQLRKRFRDTVQRFDPQLAALYTDRRAKFRRRVDHLAMRGWQSWYSYSDWI
ncbi:uncharacterized protein B0H18DRAFT_1122494 [Fomitopsis serialis]|uniref:uncharacterized protein n=1 Tax=Fomitopsis serialis TaxID=139415 RepID=UPI00200831F7|nr:uncharacterized protein B0H18DRAFT_1122494 [Neoantrodia serialis]KAH9919368.1 hypothetical protein B0H18DRAFT_1122494 [Neoantrodia serialis]